LIAIGLRRSELLALRWTDFDAAAGIISVCGQVIREKVKPRLSRQDQDSGRPRVIPLPAFAVATLTERRSLR
jgi:integrase